MKGGMYRDEQIVFDATGLRKGRMLQLGSKPWRFYGEKFTAMGFEVVGVDLNGEENCLPIDLCKPDALRHLGTFDIVTNFGTTEHCGDTPEEQAACWKNVDMAIHPGGWLISTTPNFDKWKGHGRWLPTLAWFTEFSLGNRFTVHRLTFSEDYHLVLYAGQKDPESGFFFPPTGMNEDVTGGDKLREKERALRVGHAIDGS